MGQSTWPEVPVLEDVGHQGQVKLQPAERGLVMQGPGRCPLCMWAKRRSAQQVRRD